MPGACGSGAGELACQHSAYMEMDITIEEELFHLGDIVVGSIQLFPVGIGILDANLEDTSEYK